MYVHTQSSEPNDILKREESTILHLLWILMLHYKLGYTISSDTRMDTALFLLKRVLLVWINSVLPGQNITNLHTDWRCGRTLSALVNYCKPGLIPDYAQLKTEFAIQNIRNAMSLAEIHFGIPQIVEADDLSIDKPDELSVILYLSYFCSRSSPGQKGLLSWISEQIPEQNISNFSTDWINGKALGILTHVISEGKFDAHAGMNPNNSLQNIEQSMIAAEKLLGVRRTLTVEKFASAKLDMLSRLSYLSQFYHAKVTHNAPALVPPAPEKVKVSQIQYPDKIGKGRLVWVELDCSEAGYGKVRAEVEGKKTGVVQATVKEIASDEGYGTDQYKVIFEPPEIDIYKFSVFYGESHIPGSPFSVNFHPPNADAVKYQGTTHPDKQNKDVALTFDTKEAGQGKLKAKASGEVIGGVPVKTSLEADGTYNITFTPPAPDIYIVDVLWGKFSAHAIGENTGPVPLKVDQSQQGNEYNVTFKPPTADVYTVDVNWEGVPVPGSPFTLDLLPPPQPDEVECAVPTYSDPGEEAELLVDTSNAGSGKLRATCTGVESGDVPVELVRMPGRTYQIAFNPPRKDLYTLSVLFHDKHVKGSPFTFDMRPGVEVQYGEILDEEYEDISAQRIAKEVPDASKCVIIESPKSGTIVPLNKPTGFTVDACNAGPGELDVVVKGATADAYPPKVEVVERDDDKGVYDVLFTPLASGSYLINLLWFNDPLKNTPIELHAMDPSDVHNFAHGKPIGIDIDTDNKLGDLKAYAIYHDTGAQLKVKVTKGSQKNKYKLSFQPKDPGLYRVHSLAKDKELPRSPIFVHYGIPPKPEACVVVGLKNNYYINEPVAFQVDVSAAGSGDLAIKATGPKQKKEKPELTLNYNQGIYTVVYIPHSAGEHSFDIIWSGKSIPSSPFKINVMDHPSKADKCIVRDITHSVHVGLPISFTVDTREAGTGKLNIKTILPPSQSTTEKPVLKVNDNKDRTYTAEFVPIVPGDHKFEVQWSGEAVQGSPFTIFVLGTETKEAALDFTDVIEDIPLETEFTTTPSVVSNPTEITITIGMPLKLKVRPQNDRQRFGKLVAEAEGKRPHPGEVKITQDSDGVFNVTFNPTEPDRYILTVTLNGEPIPKSPFYVNYIPAPLAEKVCVKEFATGEIQLGQPIDLVVDTSEAGTGKLTASCNGEKSGNVSVDVVPVNNDSKQYLVKFVPLHPDLYKLSIFYDKIAIRGSPYAIDLRQQKIEKEPIEEQISIEELVVDEIEPGQEVDISIDIGNAKPGTLTATCNGEGCGKVPIDIVPVGLDSKKYQIKLTPPQPDLYKVSVFYNETEIKRSPFMIDLRRQKVVEEVDRVVLEDNVEALPDLETKPKDADEPVTLEQPPSEEFTIYVGKTLLVKVKPYTEAQRKGEVSATAVGETVGSTDITTAHKDDCFLVTFNPRDPDRYAVDIKLNDESIPRSPFIVNYIMPPTDPSKCKILAANELPQIVEVGEVVTFLLNANDAGPGDLTVTVDPPPHESEVLESSQLSATKMPEETATYDVTYVPNSHGYHFLNLLWAEQAIPQSPVKIMAVDSSKVELYPHGKPIGVDIESSSKQGDLKAHVIHKDTNTQLKVKISKVQKGKYRFSFSPNVPGLYFLHIFAHGKELPQSPIAIRYARPAIPEACMVERLREKYYLGETINFTVNAKEAGDGELNVKCDKGSVLVTDNKDASYSVAFTPTSPGPHNLAITWAERAIQGTPFTFSVVDHAEEEMISWLYLIDRVGTRHEIDFPSGSQIELPATTDNQLLLKIKAGTPEHKFGKLSVNAVKSATGESTTVPVSKVSDDVFEALFLPPSEGIFRIDARLNEEQVPNTPVVVNYTTPPAIASKCKILGLENLPETFQVFKPIPFQIDTRLAGDGKLSITADGVQTKPKLEARANSEEPRIVDVNYVPTASGSHRLRILWSNEPIPESPLSFNVEAIPLYPHGKTITMERDIDGKLSEIDVYAIHEDTKARLKVKISKVTKGKFRLTFSPKQSGLYALHILLNKKDIKGSPIYIRYQGPPDASKCVVRDLSGENYLLEPITFTVDATNAGSAPLKVDVMPPSKGTKEVELTVTDNEDGTYVVSCIPQVTGTHKFPIVWGGKRIPDSPVIVDVQRRVATVKKSLGPYTNVIAVGQYVSLCVTNVAKYINENFLKAEVSALESQDKPTVTKQDDGSYLVNFVPTVPDDYTLTVKIHEEHVKDSPFFVKAVKEFSLKADFQHPEGIAHSDVEAGQSVCLIIPRDEAMPKNLSVTTNGPEGPCDTVMVNELESSCGLDFTPTVPGEYILHVRDVQTESEMSNSPFKITAIKKESDALKVFVPEESQRVFAEPIPVGSVAAFDIDTSKAGYGTLKVKSSGQGRASYRLLDKSDGIYTCEISPEVEGVCQINVLWKDEEIRDSPFAANYIKLSKPDKCSVSDIPTSVLVGDPISFTVDTREAGTGKLNIKTTLPPSKSAAEKPVLKMKDNKDRTYTAELVPNNPGDHEFEVLWSGEPVQGSPFTVSVLEKEDVNQDINELLDNFMQETPIEETISIEELVLDEMEPGQQVDISIDIGDVKPGTLTATCCGEECGNIPIDIVPVGLNSNKYQMKFTPPQPDQYKVSVFYNETEIKRSPFMIDLRRQKVVEEVDRVVLEDNVEALPDLETKLKDADEPVTLEQPPSEEFTIYVGKTLLVKVKPYTEAQRKGEVSATAVGETVGSTDITTAHKDDCFLVTFNPRDPDRYAVDIKLNDESIPRSPFIVNYIMPPTDPSKCKILAANELPQIVEVGEVVTFLLNANDAGPGDLTVTVDPPPHESEVLESSQLSATKMPEETATYDVTYVPNSHGYHSLNLLWAEQAIPQSPVKIMAVDSSKVELYPHGKPIGVDIESSSRQGDLKAHVIHKDTNTQLKVKISKVQKGKYRFSFSPKDPGLYFLHIFAQGKELPQSPIAIRYARPAIPEACKVERLREKYYLGETINFTVNAKEAGDGELNVKCDKGSVQVTDNKDATYSVEFTPTSPGPHNLAIMWAERAIQGTPFTFSVVDQAEEEMISWLYLIDRVGTRHEIDFPSGSQIELPATTDNQLLLKIKAGTPEHKFGKLSVNAVKSATGESTTVPVSKVSDDVFEALFLAPSEGIFRIDAHLNEEQVPNTPVVVNYTTPPAIASKCKILGLEHLPETFQVNKPIPFQIDTRLAGDGKLSITADGVQTKPKLEARANSEEPRIVDVNYVPTAPGSHRLRILWSNEPIPESPLSFNVEAIPLYPHGKTITMERDIDGKLNEIDVYAIHEDTKAHLKVKISKVTKGKFRLTFSPKQPGLYALHILLNKKDIKGSPIYIRYQGPPDASKCVIRDLSEVNYLLEPITFTVDATNAGSAPLKVDVMPPSKGTKEVELTVTDNKDGTYVVSCIPQVTGTHKFPIVWGGKRIPDSPVIIDVQRRVATVKKSLGPYTNVVAVGQPVSLCVTNVAKYVNENFLKAEVSALESQDKPTTTKQDDGSYLVNFVPTVPDDYTLTVKIHEEHVKGSPFFVKAVEESSLKADFQHPEGIAHSDVEAGQSVCLIIPRDEANLSVTTNGPEGPCDTVMVNKLESSCGLDFTPTVPGEYILHVRDVQTESEVSNSPFKITAIKKESDALKVFVPEESQRVFAEPIPVGSVAAFDIDTSKAGYGTLKVKSSGQGRASYRLLDKSDGIYTCEISPEVEGVCQINVLWKDEEIRDSPFAANYIKLSKPDKCSVSDIPTSVLVGDPISFTVDTREAGTGKLNIKTTLPPSKSAAEKPVLKMNDNKDRTYTAELVPNNPGDHEFEVLWSGEPVQGSPFTVSVLEKEDVNQDISKLLDDFMQETPIEETISIEELVLDEMEPGQQVDISIDIGDAKPGTLTATCCGVECGNIPIDIVPVGLDSNKYQMKFTPPQPDQYKVSVFYNETEIKRSPFMIDLRRQKVVEEVDRVVLEDNVEALPDLETKLKDADEPVTLEQPPSEEFTIYVGKTLLVKVKPYTEAQRKGEVSATAVGETVGSTDITTAHKDDCFLVTFNPRDPDRYAVDIKLNDESIPRSPFIVNYIMPPTDPSKCKILAANELPHIVEVGEVVTFLLNANDAGPGDLTVTVDPPPHESEVLESSQLSATKMPEETATYDVTYVPNAHGYHSLNLLWADQAIPQSPIKIMAVDSSKVELYPHGKPIGVDIESSSKQGDLKAHVIHKDTNTQLKVKISKVQKGKYRFSFSPKDPGLYFLHIFAHGKELPQSPIAIRYARPAIPEACKVERLREKYYLGETINFTVNAKEAGDGELNVKCDKGSVLVTDNKDATYSVEFTPTSPGPHNLAITWAERAIQGTPFTFSVVDHAEEEMISWLYLIDRVGTRHEIDFPSGSQIELPATTDNQLLLKIKAGTPEHKFGKLSVNAVKSATGESTTVPVSKVSDDVFEALFLPPTEGIFRIDAHLNEEQVPNTPVVVNYTTPPAIASKCKILGLENLPETFQVFKPIPFQIDTRLAGDGKLSITADGVQTKPKLEARANSEEPRIVDVNYVPTASGSHRLRILWSNEPIPESPLSFNVEAIPLYPHGKTITMERDIDGKLSEIDVYAIHEDTKARLKVKISKVTKGKFRLTFSPKQSGLYALHILLNKKDIKGSPIYIRYQGPPDASKCVIRDLSGENYLLEPITFTVDATNAGSAPLKVDVMPPSKGTKEVELTVTDNEDGTYVVSCIPQVTGTHKFPIVWGGKRIPDSPVIVDVQRRVATVKKSLGPYTNVVAVGQSVSLCVTNVAKYINENFLKAEVSALESQDKPTTTKQDDGSYLVNFVPTVPDDYTLTVKIHEEHVKGSPFFVKAVEESSLKADFQHPEGIAHSDVEAGQSVCLIIPRDEAMPKNLRVTTNGPEGPCDTVMINELESSCGLDFTPTVPGEYILHVRDVQTESEVSNSPFKITAIKKESDALKVFVPEESQRVFAEPIPVGSVAAFDIDTSKAGYGTLKVKSSGPGKADIRVVDKGDAIYGCEITPQEEGACYLEILWKDESIRGSPFTLKFCALTGLNLEGENFNLETPYNFRVDCDKVYNGLLEITCDDSQAAELSIDKAADQRSYECTIVAKKEGDYKMLVKYNGRHIVGSPFNVHFKKSAGTNVSFSLNAEGADTRNVSATAQSTSTLENVPLQLTQLLGGNYNIELEPTQGLEYLLTIKCLVKIKAKEEMIAGSPFSLSYAKLTSDASKCFVEGEFSGAQVGKWSSFFVETRDAGSGELAVSIDGDVDPETTITSISPTKFKVQYRLWRSGIHRISITWDGKQIPGSPFEVQSKIPKVITAFGSPKFPTEIVHGKPLEFALKPESPLEEGTLSIFAQSKLYGSIPGSVTSDESGAYKCSIDIKHAGRYTVAVTWNNIPIQGTPFEVKIVQPPKPENVRVYGPGLEDGYVGQKGEFTIETTNAGSGTLSVNVKGPKGMKINLERNPDQDRVITAQYKSESAGVYSFDVEWSGVHVPGSPFTVNIKAAPTDKNGDGLMV